MKLSTKVVVAVAVAAYASVIEAAPAAFCQDNGQVCFQWGVLEGASSTASSLYFQLRAPTSYAWFALGTGSSMRGSSMFVVYHDGNNVTLSTRKGKGHSLPQYESRSDVELLPGSGIVNGNVVANVKCTQCSDISIGSSSNWISAWKTGPPVDSTSPSAPISYHDKQAAFSVDLKQATIDSDVNPFLTDSTNGDKKPSPSGVKIKKDNTKTLLSAHGIIMAIAFLVGYPIGSALMPLLGKWLIHAGWQLLAFAGMWTGFALGYIISSRSDTFFQDKHMRLGVIVTILMTVQPALGWLHHVHFVKYKRRGAISHIHMWYGRGIMTLGIVNGGIGLDLANASSGLVIAYSIVAVVVSIVYMCSMGFGIFKRNRQATDTKN